LVHGKNDSAKGSQILLDTDENNFVRTLKIMTLKIMLQNI